MCLWLFLIVHSVFSIFSHLKFAPLLNCVILSVTLHSAFFAQGEKKKRLVISQQLCKYFLFFIFSVTMVLVSSVARQANTGDSDDYLRVPLQTQQAGLPYSSYHANMIMPPLSLSLSLTQTRCHLS